MGGCIYEILINIYWNIKILVNASAVKLNLQRAGLLVISDRGDVR